MEKRELQQAAQLVYDYLMHSKPDSWGSHAWTDWAMNVNSWDWNSGVGLIAAAEYGSLSADSHIWSELEAWVTRNRGQSESLKVINSIAPFAIFPELYAKTGEVYYSEKAREIALWLMEQAPRTSSGAFEHTVTEKASFSEEVWADTIFMAVLFLARTAKLHEDSRMAGEALSQVLLHLQALQDSKSGLLYHGWNCETRSWMSAALWNRANAWNAVGIPMILEAAGSAGADDLLTEIKERYHRLAEALMKQQQPDGLWPTVLDRPSFYAETSGSAGIACGLYKAARLGLIPEARCSGADLAVVAVLSKIRADGSVADVSGGTPVLASIEAYNEVPRFPTLYGQGLTLMLLSEAMERSIGVPL